MITKERIKEFVKEHKKAIIIAVSTGVMSGLVGYKYCININNKYLKMDEIETGFIEFLRVMDPLVKDAVGVYTFHDDESYLKIEDAEKVIAELFKNFTDHSIEMTGIAVFTKQKINAF